ncbi:MAG: ABC transporter permease [Proteobacteria bacterium]|nr:ABC transporter permease [Pseudomonadota bacterium]
MTDPVTENTLWRRLRDGKTGPIMVIVAALILAWYAGAIYLNTPWQIEVFERAEQDWTASDMVRETWAQERPVLPSPHQVFEELYISVFTFKPTSKRSLLYHAGVTASSTLLGFLFGSLLGIVLAVGIVHNRTLDHSLLPWVITSQTIPILAIAPMIIVVLGAIGLKGLIPKAIISTYLCFFPVTIGMVKGLRSPDPLQNDLMRTYSASDNQVFWKLRAPCSTPFLFTSLKIAAASSLVGAIVGELPTGAQAGIGARLLAGSYYGQTIQIWSALIMGSLMAALFVTAIAVIEKRVVGRMGLRS